jgi:hypothetical protein
VFTPLATPLRKTLQKLFRELRHMANLVVSDGCRDFPIPVIWAQAIFGGVIADVPPGAASTTPETIFGHRYA